MAPRHVTGRDEYYLFANEMPTVDLMAWDIVQPGVRSNECFPTQSGSLAFSYSISISSTAQNYQNFIQNFHLSEQFGVEFIHWIDELKFEEKIVMLKLSFFIVLFWRVL